MADNPRPRFHVLRGIAYLSVGQKEPRRIKAGATVDDLNPKAAKWLEAQGAIRRLPAQPDTSGDEPDQSDQPDESGDENNNPEGE